LPTRDVTRYLEKISEDLDILSVPYKEARARSIASRLTYGFTNNSYSLLTLPTSNYKLSLSGRPTFGLSLAPANTSKEYNNCRHSTKGCRELCVAHAGQGSMDSVAHARAWRTSFLMSNPGDFLAILHHEISKHKENNDEQIAIRLNNFSDLRWEKISPQLFDLHKDVQFYDYTKWSESLRPSNSLPDNYYLIYSRNEKSKEYDVSLRNMAVVFSTKKGAPLPQTWEGMTVVDGDIQDERYLDPNGVVVGLRAKGRARKSKSKFVVQV
jgi:hypothetical protein